jgi:hypothetical protein
MKNLYLLSTALLAGIALTGCGITPVAESPVVIQGGTIKGSVFGGQQPIANATVQLYATGSAAGSSGYGSASTALITPTSAGAAYPVTTGTTGYFTITGTFTCPTPNTTPVYLVVTGGNPIGSAANANIALMAALGPCNNLINIPFVNVDEITTVASVWALSPFMKAYDHIGTSTSNTLGLSNAFASVNKMVDIAAGTTPGPALPTGATLPTDEINALGNILASCVNSAGGSASENGGSAPTSNCGKLFSYTTPSGGSAPTDTITAAMNIAQNPAQNVSNLFNLVTAAGAAFTTSETLPTSWTIAINYTGGGLSGPKGIATDASGDVWLANNTGNSVTELSNTGAAISSSSGYTGGSLSAPWGIALDSGGNAWVTNNTGSSITYISSAGTGATKYSGNGLNKPKGIAIDSVGNIWVANSGSNYVSAFTSTGTALSFYTGGGVATPIGIAVNPQ